jgi:hypothetical protein
MRIRLSFIIFPLFALLDLFFFCFILSLTTSPRVLDLSSYLNFFLARHFQTLFIIRSNIPEKVAQKNCSFPFLFWLFLKGKI